MSVEVSAQAVSATVPGFESLADFAKLAGLGTPLLFGGVGVLAGSDFLVYNGNALLAAAAGLDFTSQGVVAAAQTCTRCSWYSAAASATTVMGLWVNNAEVATVTLSGVRGTIALAAPLVLAAADRVGILYKSGTAPTGMTFNLL